MNREEFLEFKKNDPEWQEREKNGHTRSRAEYMRIYNQRPEVKQKTRDRANRRRKQRAESSQ